MKKYYLLFVLFVNACSSNSISPCVPVKTTGPIIPLALGNQWIYRVTNFDDQGNSYPYPIQDTVTISQDTIIKGERWFFRNQSILTNRSDGLWGQFSLTPDSLIPVLFDKYPANTGDISIFPYDDTTIVVSNDTTVTVPYGCFYSYHYIVVPANYSPMRFFTVPGVGEVRIEKWTGLYGSRFHKYQQQELVSVTLH